MSSTQNQPTGHPSIRINGTPISPEAIEFEFMRLVHFYREHLPEERIQEQMPMLRHRAVDQAIGARLLMDEAARLDLRVSDDRIDARILKTETEVGGKESLERMLKKQNLTAEAFRAQMERTCRIDMLIEKAVSLADDPTENDIRDHFEANQESYARAPRMRVRHLLLKVGPDEKHPDGAAAREVLKTLRQRLVGGADFTELAAEFSDCPSGLQTGGSLGWVSPGMLTAVFEQAVSALPVGEPSDILETELGLHLVIKDAEEPAEAVDFDTARENIRDFLRHAARGKALSAYIDELRHDAVIEGAPTVAEEPEDA